MNPVIKFLLLLALLVATAAGLLWYAGGNPREFQSTVVIDANPDTVFKCLSAPELRTRWVLNLRETGLVTGSAPELLSVYQSVYERQGQAVKAEERIQNMAPNQYLVIRTRDEQWEWMSIFRLEGKSKQTQLEYVGRLLPLSINRLMFAFYQGKDQQRIEQELLALKELAETLGDASQNPTAASRADANSATPSAPPNAATPGK
jgi:uncharacterized protein YndB with AHSA1/START domain